MTHTIRRTIKKISCVALLGAATSVTLPAHAQSNVTLYGILDAGLSYVSNQGGGHLFAFQDGLNYGSRFGFKGSEDLGGGMQAIFQLENGFSVGTGALRNFGALFGRTALVGISSRYGTVTLGNQYDFVRDYISQFNLNGFASVYAGHMGDFDRISGSTLSNSIKFSSANYNGLTFGAMFKFGNVAGNFGSNNGWSAGLGYNHSGFKFGAEYLLIHNVAIYPYAQIGVTRFLGQTVATRNADGTVTDLFYTTPITVSRQTTAGAGASYDIGRLTLAANFTSTNFHYAGNSATMNVYEGGALFKVTPSAFILGGYQYTTFDGHHWHQPTLGAQYYLSKRTSFYANVSYLRASAGVDANQGAGFYALPSSTRTQVTTRIAMVHRF